ncbi:MAG TPA: cbb3-type cytochrome c oxidase subunit I, partial [Burkholderiales bacterium]
MDTRSLYADAAAPASAHYALAVPAGARRALAAGWMWLALASLVGSGLFSILLVLSRAPYVKDFFPFADFFRVALVVHVDLSVLVWFAAFGGLLWSLHAAPRLLGLGWAALALCAAGTLVMSLAPFAENAAPVMSNYVPVLDGGVFLSGLLVFALGCAVLILRSMAVTPRVGIRPGGAGALGFGLNAALVSAAVALIAFAWSWLALPGGLDGKAYYEVLFWGGGHVLQFTWTLLMFVAWLALADAIGARVPLSPRVAILLFAIGLVSVFVTPVIYLAYDVTSVEHYRLQTWLMRIGGGLAIAPFAFSMMYCLLSSPKPSREQKPLRAALAWSLLLFGAGGLIGLAISGSNVKIPAHYHGAIVGVTLAFMGLAYHLLPRMGYARPSPRLAALQPALYGAGQLAHVIGLVWSGGYGVQRKVAGADQVLRGFEQVAAMGLMGLGGLAAV